MLPVWSEVRTSALIRHEGTNSQTSWHSRFLNPDFNSLNIFKVLTQFMRAVPPPWMRTTLHLPQRQRTSLIVIHHSLRARTWTTQLHQVPSAREKMTSMEIRAKASTSSEHSNMGAESIRAIREKIWDVKSICMYPKFTFPQFLLIPIILNWYAALTKQAAPIQIVANALKRTKLSARNLSKMAFSQLPTCHLPFPRKRLRLKRKDQSGKLLFS